MKERKRRRFISREFQWCLIAELVAFLALMWVLVSPSMRKPRTEHDERPSMAHEEEEAIRHNNLGVALMDAGIKDAKYFDEAAKEFEAATRASPRYLLARINLGIALYYSARGEAEIKNRVLKVDKASKVLESVVRDAPDHPHAHFMLGLILKASEKSEENAQRLNEAAAEHFRAVVKHDPSDAVSHLLLGYTLEQLGRYAEAASSFRQAVKLDPNNLELRYRLAQSLQRAGKSKEAQEQIIAFENLRKAKVESGGTDKSLDWSYTQRGKYSETIADSRIIAQPPEPTSDYTDVTQQVGLQFKHNGTARDADVQKILKGEPMPREWFANEKNKRRLIAAFGSGCSFCDYNNDGKLDIFLVNANGAHALWEQTIGFENVTETVGLKRKPTLGMACVWGDYDNDGWADLFITGYGDVRLYHNNKGKFEDVTEKSGIAQSITPSTWCMGAAFADVDHDGDLDIYVCCFADLTRLPNKPMLKFPDDFQGQPNLLFRNNSADRHASSAGYRAPTPFTEIAKQAKADSGAHLTRSAYFSDVNNDRVIDFVLFDAAGKATTFLNNKEGTFSRRSDLSGKVPHQIEASAESRALGDFNADGGLDVLINRNGLDAVLKDNRFHPWKDGQIYYRNWLAVRLKGYPQKSNSMGIGAKVEVRSVGMWQIKELRAGNGALGCDAPIVYFDLGNQTRIDFVRVIFPSGDRKTVRDVNANQVLTIDEPELECNSCPTLFSWNGKRFEFITDTISAGILGELVAPGQYWQPDPDEWVRVTSEQLKPYDERRMENGKWKMETAYELRFVNPLEEVTYLDHVRLVAVDHPTNVEIYPNERMVNEPQNRERTKFYALTNLRPIAQATDHHEHDVTPVLAQIDRRYFDCFQRLPFKGFAENWSLTLDLGQRNTQYATRNTPVLLLHSWSYWNSSASIIAAAQAQQTLWGPTLDVLGTDGKWRVGIEDMGVSAGLPRTILVDLSNVLKRGEHVVRIRSNRTLYYDQALVADAVRCWDWGSGFLSNVRVTELPLLRGNLRWLGYPKRVLPDGKLPEVPDYQQIEPQSEWGTHAGMLTRTGDVTPLLTESDDKFVVMNHGEEIALSFDAGKAPPLSKGWKRTFLFYSDGYEKGYELHSARSQTVEPLPFHAMKSYPDDEQRYPMDEAHWRYLFEWNTRPSFMR